MTTILLAYVPSATSEAALAYAIAEARRREARLLVLASERGADPRKARTIADPRPLEQRLAETDLEVELRTDRKSTRLNSSHVAISYAVFCLKKNMAPHVWSCLVPERV